MKPLRNLSRRPQARSVIWLRPLLGTIIRLKTVIVQTGITGAIMSEFIVELENVTEAQGNKLAQNLAQQLKSASPNVEAQPRRTSPNAQDFGASLIIVLGTPAVVAVATAIGTWIARTGTSVTIKDESGQVLVKNVKSGDVPKVVEALKRNRG